MHGRAVKALARKLGLRDGALADDLTATVGQTGAAHPGLVLASMVEQAEPGQVLAVVALADGADVLVFRTTGALEAWSAPEPVADQIAAAADLPYGKFLSWRGMVTPEPPRRPEPQRVSSSAAWRNEEWKFGFVGSKDRTSEAVHLPPSRVSMKGGAVDDMDPVDRADTEATIATYTIDRLAYSPSPPIVFAVLDFDGGGRFPVELTDVDPDTVDIGDRVAMTFRQAVHRRRHPRLLLEGQAGPDRRRPLAARPVEPDSPNGRTAGPTGPIERTVGPVRSGPIGCRAQGDRQWDRMGSRTGWRSSAWGAPGSPSTGTRASTT